MGQAPGPGYRPLPGNGLHANHKRGRAGGPKPEYWRGCVRPADPAPGHPGHTNQPGSRPGCLRPSGQRSRSGDKAEGGRRTSTPEHVREGRGRPWLTRNGARRCGQLGDLLAAAAGLLQSGGQGQLQPGRDQLKDLADVLTNKAKGAAAFRAVITGVQHDAFAGRAFPDQGLAAAWRVGGCGLFFSTQFGVVIGQGRADRRSPGNLQVLERQFQLFDLA